MYAIRSYYVFACPGRDLTFPGSCSEVYVRFLLRYFNSDSLYSYLTSGLGPVKDECPMMIRHKLVSLPAIVICEEDKSLLIVFFKQYNSH